MQDCLPQNSTQKHRLQLLDCVTYFLFYPVDEGKVATEMPAGYEAVFDVPTAGLDAFLCASGVVDNTTVQEDIELYAVSVLTNPPSDLERPDGADIYYLEICVNEGAVAQLLRDEGLVICNGAVQITGDQVDIAFMQNGQTAYHFMGAGEESQNPERTDAVRIHQSTAGRGIWVDRESQVTNPSVGQMGLLQVSGGMISRILAHSGPATIAHSGIGGGTFVFDFPERQTGEPT